jgi:myo-inositol-1(or 4)-monophosphatase
MAEREIVRTVHKAYPGHAILGEEGGAQGDSEYEWVIDPLDGTTNYLYGFPQFAVSIAVRHRKQIEHAVVYDPLKEELFAASRGSGATLNNRKIRVSERKDLEGALLGTGIPFRADQDIERWVAALRVLLPDSAGVRRAGSAALDLAYVAAGRLDGFWEYGLKPWDMAAGILLIREAGGLVTDPLGGEGYFKSGDVLAGNPKLMKVMLSALRSAKA